MPSFFLLDFLHPTDLGGGEDEGGERLNIWGPPRGEMATERVMGECVSFHLKSTIQLGKFYVAVSRFSLHPPPPPILSIDVSYSRVIYAVTRFQRGNKKAPTGRKEPGALRCGIFLSSEIGRGGGGGKMGPNAGGMMWAKKNRSKQL